MNFTVNCIAKVKNEKKRREWPLEKNSPTEISKSFVIIVNKIKRKCLSDEQINLKRSK